MVASILTWVSFNEPSGFLWTVIQMIGGFGQIQLQKANGAVLATPSAETVEIKLVELGNYYIYNWNLTLLNILIKVIKFN